MFSPRPPDRVPQGVPPATGVYLRRTGAQLEALSRFQGVAVSGGTLPTEVIPQAQWIFGQIRDEESSSSDSSSANGTGQFSLNPLGVGFTDEDGYLAYAFDEIYSDYPWKGIVILNGISTTLPDSAGLIGGANYAYPLNNDVYVAGANIILKRAGNHWVIVGTVGSPDTSSDTESFTFTVDCEEGIIVVGDSEPPLPPTSSDGGTTDPGTDQKKPGGRSGSITTDTGDPGIP